LEAELAQYQQQFLAVEQQWAQIKTAPSSTRLTPQQPMSNVDDSGNTGLSSPAPPALEALQEEDEEEEWPWAVQPSPASRGTNRAQNRVRSVGKDKKEERPWAVQSGPASGATNTRAQNRARSVGKAHPACEARPLSSPRRGVPLQRAAQRRVSSPWREATTPPSPAPFLRQQPSPRGALSRGSRCLASGKLIPQPAVTVS
jgi:hypothetical protein